MLFFNNKFFKKILYLFLFFFKAFPISLTVTFGVSVDFFYHSLVQWFGSGSLKYKLPFWLNTYKGILKGFP